MIDIRTQRSAAQRECSWIRKFGAHEEAGWCISLNNKSANITEPKIDITWIIDRTDIPSAFEADPVNLSQLKTELRTAICARMTPEVLDLVFQAIRSMNQSAFWAGERDVQQKICQVLGITK